MQSDLKMSEKKNVETEEYQFIREKIATQKKTRYKRWILSGVCVVIFAIVFGFVGRLTFVKSEGLVNKILGITPTETPPIITKTPITIPPVTVTNAPTPTLSPTPTPTDIPEVTSEPENPKDNEVSSIDTVVELFEIVSEVARNATKYMSQMVYVKTSTDWFGEVLENDTVGSGIIIGDNGVELLILVDSTRAAEADRIDVIIAGRRIKDLKISASASEYGLAIATLSLEELTGAELEKIEYAVFGDSSTVSVGTPVIAIGNPNGYYGTFELATITSQGENVYLTDNRIAIYNTGIAENLAGDGVLINLSGQIVGIITHNFKESKNENVISMVGINNLKYTIQNLANNSASNYFGVVVKEAPQSVLEKNNLTYGLYVTEVKEDSPAEKAGIKKGDIITSLDNRVVSSVDDFARYIEAAEEGKIISVDLMRSGEMNKGIKVTIEN